jgi:hypothetical protein
VAAKVFGYRVDDDIRTVLDRPAEERGSERVVDDERYAGVARDRGDGRDVDTLGCGLPIVSA